MPRRARFAPIAARPERSARGRPRLRHLLQCPLPSFAGQSSALPLVSILLAVILSFSSPHALELTGRWIGRIEPTNLSAEIELDLQRPGDSWNDFPLLKQPRGA